ncbi:MAG: cation:dicarboxylase symporter family transporter [Myxococcaceae bacterium]|nr:cation:dicarboxylase symporter family transporter [Myxococcaceae bacterium]MBH2006201.1 cation:dicarboxylase symporter family transporter [Myxococcaceae bacterium]
MTQVILIVSIVLGGMLGMQFPAFGRSLAPLGDAFINLLLVTVLPLVFFSISGAISKLGHRQQSRNLFMAMGLVYGFLSWMVALATGLVLIGLFHGNPSAQSSLQAPVLAEIDLFFIVKNFFSVTNWTELFATKNILALILFSILTGLAAREDQKCQDCFAVAEKLLMRMFDRVMKFAPLGFLAFFASLVGQMGGEAISKYLEILVIYHLWGGIWALVLFGFAFCLVGRSLFPALVLPSLTSVATCSSIASIPANLKAAERLQIPKSIYEVSTPIGAILFKQGSVMGGMCKIAFLFSFYHQDLASWPVFMSAVGVSVLVGCVMGAIPGGGSIGELFILSVYGFPQEALMSIVAISLLIDPMATFLSVTGNTVANLFIQRQIDILNRFTSLRLLP